MTGYLLLTKGEASLALTDPVGAIMRATDVEV